MMAAMAQPHALVPPLPLCRLLLLRAQLPRDRKFGSGRRHGRRAVVVEEQREEAFLGLLDLFPILFHRFFRRLVPHFDRFAVRVDDLELRRERVPVRRRHGNVPAEVFDRSVLVPLDDPDAVVEVYVPFPRGGGERGLCDGARTRRVRVDHPLRREDHVGDQSRMVREQVRHGVLLAVVELGEKRVEQQVDEGPTRVRVAEQEAAGVEAVAVGRDNEKGRVVRGRSRDEVERAEDVLFNGLFRRHDHQVGIREPKPAPKVSGAPVAIWRARTIPCSGSRPSTVGAQRSYSTIPPGSRASIRSR